MKIFRVEHKNTGDGPYYDSTFRDAWQSAPHSTSTGHIDPLDIKSGFDYEQYEDLCRGWRSGFKSMNDLQSWFNENELDKLSQFGYIITAFEVPCNYVHVGNNQVIFRRPNVKETREEKETTEAGNDLHAEQSQVS